MCIVTKHRHWSDGVYGDYYLDGRIIISYNFGGARSGWGNLIAFNGTVSDASDGTMITGSFKTSMFMPVLFWLFRAFLVFFVVMFLLIYYGYVHTRGFFIGISTPTPLLILTPIMLLITFLLEWISKTQAKEGKEIILHLLKKELCATIYDYN